MEKLSGLVLDAYDDTDGSILRTMWTSMHDVPEVVKTASALTPEERDALPDDLFALILQDGDVTLRKYACADSGNTVLNVAYFLSSGHKLPEEAQKVAAANLLTACGWYDIPPPPELQKIAFGALGLLHAATLPSVVKGTKEQIDKNLSIAKASGSVVNPAARRV